MLTQKNLSTWLLVPCWLLGISTLVHSADVKVYFNDKANKKPNADLSGAIQAETIAGIKLKPSGNTPAREIPAVDIVEIDYYPTGADRLRVRPPFNAEERGQKATKLDDKKKFYLEAVEKYNDLIPTLDDNPNAKRYAEFRRAQTLARLSELDPEKEADAIKALSDYRTLHGESWEMHASTQLLAALYEKKKQFTMVERTYEQLASKPGLPKELATSVNLTLVKLLIQKHENETVDAQKAKLLKAEQKLDQLLKDLPAEDPMVPKLKVYHAECHVAAGRTAEAEKALRPLLAHSDANVKAMAHNTLGDAYLVNNKKDEAFWQYLHVDVLYNDDAQEHARALYHLSKLFLDQKKDPVKAQLCKDKLLKDKLYIDSSYRKLAEQNK